MKKVWHDGRLWDILATEEDYLDGDILFARTPSAETGYMYKAINTFWDKHCLDSKESRMVMDEIRIQENKLKDLERKLGAMK